jgi:protein-tyrosine phosphatase
MNHPGRIDVHTHLIPAVDDGCASCEQSIICARVLVEHGYTHAFCTPHIWRSLPANTPESVSLGTGQLQRFLDEAAVGLRVLSGGELSLRPELADWPRERFPTYACAGRFLLFDLWADILPEWFEPAIRHIQSLGITAIIAHPERMKAVQDQPEKLADWFDRLGLLMQGNLQCFSDPEDWATRRLAERYLREGRYFLLGSDTHTPESLACRMAGLRRAIELAGNREVDRLTRVNPRMLLP